MKRTYIDAFQGQESTSNKALGVLDDPDRSLVVSDYLRLEVLPKPTFHKNQTEIAFMETVLSSACENVPSTPRLAAMAIGLASRYDLTPIDALHVSAAVIAGVDELVTGEKDTKPMFRVQEVKVVSLSSTARGSQ
jgi:predicted nucleic acid-binding protein